MNFVNEHDTKGALEAHSEAHTPQRTTSPNALIPPWLMNTLLPQNNKVCESKQNNFCRQNPYKVLRDTKDCFTINQLINFPIKILYTWFHLSIPTQPPDPMSSQHVVFGNLPMFQLTFRCNWVIVVSNPILQLSSWVSLWTNILLCVLTLIIFSTNAMEFLKLLHGRHLPWQ